MAKVVGALLLLLVLAVAGGAVLSDAASNKLPKEQPANTVSVNNLWYATAANASATDAIFKTIISATKKEHATFAYVMSKSVDSKTGDTYFQFAEEYNRYSGWLAHLTNPNLDGILPKALQFSSWVTYHVTTFNKSEVPLLDAKLKTFGLPYRVFLGQPGSFRH